MDFVTIVRDSWPYRLFATLRRWAKGSFIISLMAKERSQLGFIAIVLLVSLGSVFRSDATAAVKFLSFALLFVLTVVVTWSLTNPLAE